MIREGNLRRYGMSEMIILLRASMARSPTLDGSSNNLESIDCLLRRNDLRNHGHLGMQLVVRIILGGFA